jgi:hypothetical protein
LTLSEDAFHQFAADLLARTEDGKVPWAPFTEDDGFAFVGSAAAVVVRSRDGDGAYPYVLELFDGQNELRETLHTGFDLTEHGDQEANAWNDTLARLYHAARRRALRIDELSMSILDDIDGGVSGDRPLPALPPPPQRPDDAESFPMASRHGETTPGVDDLPF